MNYSVAQAKNELSKLIARARAGEEVNITSRGVVVASINPKKPVEIGRPVDMDWLRANRVKPNRPIDALEMIELKHREYDDRLSGR